MRRAARIVEAAWKANPHPDLAEAYAHLQPGASARDRLRRGSNCWRRKRPAISKVRWRWRAPRSTRRNSRWRAARLTPLSIAPSQRVAMLMAELEEKEHGDEGRAREWMTRAVRAKPDPAWTADGIVSDHWMPVSPVTGRLDAFQWKDPIAELDADEAVIEHCGSPARRSARRQRRRRRISEIKPLEPKPVEAAPAVSPPAPVGRGLARTATAAAPIVPLIHVPDDPGPEPQPQLEPETEIAEPPSDSWRKLRGLFK